jgi:hypothetical protein
MTRSNFTVNRPYINFTVFFSYLLLATQDGHQVYSGFFMSESAAASYTSLYGIWGDGV